MRDYIELRAIEVGKYIIDSKATVRKTATKFGVSKSTVHKDLTERLPQIDHHLADEVRDICLLYTSLLPDLPSSDKMY